MVAPFVSQHLGYVEPTFDSPYEESHQTDTINTELLEIWFFWFFNSGTDEVYAKQSGVDIRNLSPRLTRNPRILSKPQPLYTIDARQARIKGSVILSVLFGAAGEVSDIQVIHGLSHGLTERAIEAAKEIKFVPGEVHGKKVPVRITVEYTFNSY